MGFGAQPDKTKLDTNKNSGISRIIGDLVFAP